ncbi:MAG: radical SAM protein [Candidatus Omnitrophica bacterium]|nr:radical SAM protein [Candidatus Omnitrophota bacterium]
MGNSFVLQYLQNLILPHRLSYLVFFVTARCNAACTFCLRERLPDAAKMEENTELTIDEIGRIASHMQSLAHVLISGGEPFMRNDLDQIIRSFYTRSHTRFVTIPTNGYFSDEIEDKVSRILHENRDLFLQIQISINGTQDVHDNTKRLPLSFMHLKETCGRLKKLRHSFSNLRLASITVISDSLKGNMPDLVAFLEKDLFFFDNYYLTPVIQKNGWPIENPLLPEDKEAWMCLKSKQQRRFLSFWDAYAYCTLRRSQYVINRAMKRKTAMVDCTAARRFVVLKQNGQVFPCEFPQSGAIGNLRDFQYDIMRLLRCDRSRHIRDAIVTHKCYCCWGCAMNINLISRLRSCARILLDSVFYMLKII